MTKQQKKDKAIELMKELDIYQPYIDGFEQEDKVCFFEMLAGFWVFQEPEIEKKMREIEREYKCLVYAITHEMTSIGELYDFLIVPNYKEDWENILYRQRDNSFIAYAYVWNKTDDYCSEFGSIGIRSFGGGIRRVA